MKKIMYLAAMALCVACTKKNGTEIENPEEQLIPINLSMNVKTKVTDTSYETGDKVGIYVVNYADGKSTQLLNSGNHVDNMRFSYGGSSWTPDAEIYWKDQSTKADLYCYYPYGKPSDVNSYPISVKADQSSAASYKASEFLWGKASGVAPTASAVPITTTRSLSNILVYLKPGAGFTSETLSAATKTVKINNVKVGANVNLATGVATATGSAATVTPLNIGEYYRAMMVPQTVADGTNLITINVDGVDYTFTKGFTFKANTQHRFTVTINKTSGGINIGIGGWEIDETDNGGDAE